MTTEEMWKVFERLADYLNDNGKAELRGLRANVEALVADLEAEKQRNETLRELLPKPKPLPEVKKVEERTAKVLVPRKEEAVRPHAKKEPKLVLKNKKR